MPGIKVTSSNYHTLKKYQRKTTAIRKGNGSSPWLLVFLALSIGGFIFLVWLRLQITHLGYQISRANQEQQQLLKLNGQMKLEIASLKSPAHLEYIAKNQLGLIEPQPYQVVSTK